MTGSADDGIWVRVCDPGVPALNERAEVALPDGRLLLLLRTCRGLRACPADCPHQDTPLFDVPVVDGVLTCPTHFWQWDLATGEPLGLAEMPLPLFPIREDANGVHVWMGA